MDDVNLSPSLESDSVPDTVQDAPIVTPQTVLEPPVKKPFSKIPLLVFLFLISGLALIAVLFLKKPVSSPAEVTLQPTPAPLFIALDNNETATTVVNGEFLIEGRTLPNTPVLIYSDYDETSLESDSEGVFAETIVVDDAGGLVRITAYGDDGTEVTKTIAVSEVAADPDVLGNTDKANKGQEKKDAKTNDEKSNPSSEEKKTDATGVGSETSSKVKATPKAKEVQSSKPEATVTPAQKSKQIETFIKTKTRSEKVVKLGTEKLKAMLSEGTPSAELQKTHRIKNMSVTEASAGAQLKRHAVSGVITAVSENHITLSHQIQTDRVWTVYVNSLTVIRMKDMPEASLSVLAVGMRVAAVGTPIDEGILANRIHVIPGNATGVYAKYPESSASATPKSSPTATVSATPTSTASAVPGATESGSVND